MKLETVLRQLIAASGPAGFEDGVGDALAACLAETGCTPVRDRLGSFIAVRRCGKENAPLLMLDTHIDEIGLITTVADESGFLKFGTLGGADPRIMADCEVTVLCDPPLDGVICCLPPHVQKAEDMKNFQTVNDMAIDCGMSKEEIEKRVEPGTPVVFKGAPMELINGNFVSRALDNRLCAAVAVCALDAVKSAELDYDIAFCASSMEEVGGRGARAAAFALDPNGALVMDVTFAAAKGTPEDSTFGLDELTFCVGPECDRPLTRILRNAAEQVGAAVKPEVCPRTTGTNGSDIQIARAGIPVAILSLPIRNMHTPVELVSLSNGEKAVEVVAEFLTALKGGDLL